MVGYLVRFSLCVYVCVCVCRDGLEGSEFLCMLLVSVTNPNIHISLLLPNLF